MPKILIVDDEPAVVRLLERFLSAKGYEVLSAVSGEEGLSRFHDSQPQVVLLDIHMPGKNGLEVLQEMKAHDPEASVVMITGVSDEELGRSALRMGAFDYITKPFDFDYMDKVLWLKLKLLN